MSDPVSDPARPVPDGFHTLNVHIVVVGAHDAIAFYGRAFGAIETYRVPGPDGRIMHAELRVGDSTLMLSEAFPEWGKLGPQAPTSPVLLHLYVENVDALWNQAVAAGMSVTMPLQDMFWGDRFGQLKDPFGHHWSLATHTKDLTPEEVAAAAATEMAACPPTAVEPATPLAPAAESRSEPAATKQAAARNAAGRKSAIRRPAARKPAAKAGAKAKAATATRPARPAKAVARRAKVSRARPKSRANAKAKPNARAAKAGRRG